MQRRSVANSKDDLGSVGAFIDTEGDRRKKRKGIPVISGIKDDEEARLESLVFGKQPFELQGAEAIDGEKSSEEEGSSNSESEEEREDQKCSKPLLSQKPAWKDEDDEEISVDMKEKIHRKRLRREVTDARVSGDIYSKRLRNQYERIGGQPQWATRDTEKAVRSGSESSTSDSEEEVLQRTGPLISRKCLYLPRTRLDVKRMKDANATKRAHATIQSLEFHPTANVILTAGWHKTLDLFQVDGEVNPKIQSVHVERFPISTAHFTQDGKEVIMAGERKSFFVYDMIAGKITRIYGIRGRNDRYFDKFAVSPDNQFLAFQGEDGFILLVSNKTKQWVADMKMNGEVHDVTFTPDGKHLLSFGSDGKVYVWDTSSRQCLHCFTDEGCVVGRKVCMSPDGRYVACGAQSGVVNVYDESCFRRSRPTPLRAVMNLTTPVSHLKFNSTSELLTISSQDKKDALKIVHLSSLNVFPNWPSPRTRLCHVSAFDLSPLSHYLAIGNDRGRALLFRLNHYHLH